MSADKHTIPGTRLGASNKLGSTELLPHHGYNNLADSFYFCGGNPTASLGR